MSLKNFIAQVEQSKQLSENTIAPSTTSTATAPQATGQKVMVKPGQPQQQQGPMATVTNQAGKVIAQAPAADAKKLGDMVNTGNITMMDPGTGKPLEEDVAELVAGQQPTIDEALQAIFANHPHEHKMCQEGWGMHESLYEALRDHYFAQGRIPRDKMHGDRAALQQFVEECYMQDTNGGNEEQINMMGEGNPFAPEAGSGGYELPGSIDDLDIAVIDDVADAHEKEGNQQGAQTAFAASQRKQNRPLDEVSELEKRLTNATEESTMFESKKLKGNQKNLDVAPPFGKLNKDDFKKLRAKNVDEATEETSKGKIHKAEPGGYGRKHGKEDVKDQYGAKIGKIDLEKDDSKEEKKGRGRPKKDQSPSKGEIDKDVFSAFGGGKKPKKEIGKVSAKNKITDKSRDEKADAEFEKSEKKSKVDESFAKWDSQLKSLLEGKQVNEGLSVSTSVGNEGAPDSVSITANDDDAHELLKLITSAGLGIKTDAREELLKAHGSTADGGSFSINGDEEAADAPEVVDFDGAQDSISGEEDDGMAAMKQMLAAMGIGKETAQEPKHPEGFDGEEEAEELVGEDSVDDQEATDNADDTQVAEDEDIDGGEEGQGEWAGTGDTDAAAAETEKATDEEEAEDEKVGNEAPEQDDDAEKVNESEKTECNECGAMYEGDDHTCSHDDEQLNEWANSPEGQSEEEQFQADINFMTKLISGGLNGPKVDQTVLPHTNVKANSGGYDIDVAAEMKKLAGIK